MIAETRDLDPGLLASLENGVGTVDCDRLIIDKYLKLVEQWLRRPKHPPLVWNNRLLQCLERTRRGESFSKHSLLLAKKL